MPYNSSRHPGEIIRSQGGMALFVKLSSGTETIGPTGPGLGKESVGSTVWMSSLSSEGTEYSMAWIVCSPVMMLVKTWYVVPKIAFAFPMVVVSAYQSPAEEMGVASTLLSFSQARKRETESGEGATNALT